MPHAPADHPTVTLDPSGVTPAPVPPSFDVPALGHFEAAEVLGRGGFGLVLRAFDRKLHRTVALKVLSADAAADPEPRRRFLREARAAAAVCHPHVVAVHAVEDGPRPYLVMEFLPGGSLQQRFDRTGPMAPSDVARVGVQVARGLAAAHARGLVHRDVKPANILLDAGPGLTVKVGDFGLVWVADDAGVSRYGTVVGTPHYMSPEQARGEPVDHRSDLFALGSVLYLLATGKLPFTAATSAGVLHEVAYHPPEPAHAVAPDVPRWLSDVVARLHAIDPDDRFRSAADVADALDVCLRKPQASPAPRPRPAHRPRRLTAAAFGLAVAAGVVLAVAAPFRTAAADPEPPPPAIAPTAPAGHPADPNRFTNTAGMAFVRVPKGTARLGGTEGNAGPTQAEFDRDFFLGATEVTHAEWDRVFGPRHNPSLYARDGGHQHDVAALSDDEVARLPVDSLTWNDCQEFVARLNRLAAEPGWVYRLPTVREWEYACRGGPDVTRAAAGFDFYAGDPTLTLGPDRANVRGGPGRPVPVGSYRPNRLGLYDMHGNACEFADDRTGPAGGHRALLGGWWMDESDKCRASWAGHIQPDVPFRGAGLRVARVPAQ